MTDPAPIITERADHRDLPLSRGSVVIALALAAMAFLPFLGRRDIVTSHEARVAQAARQMAAAGWPWCAELLDVPAARLDRTGGMINLLPDRHLSLLRVNPWLIPVLNEQIRLQKPPLPYWCVASFFRFFGVGEGIARLPGALMGFFATLIVLDLGRVLLGRLGGWCAAIVWTSSYFISDEFRKVMADPYLALFTLAAVWSWIRWSKSQRGWLWGIAFYLSFALGALAKGPVIFVHVLVPVLAYQICYRIRLPGRWAHHAIGVALFLLLTLPWPIYVYRHVPNAAELWRYESVGQLADNVEKARPFWFYLPGLFQIALPWTPMLAVGWLAPFLRQRRDRRWLFPLAWYATGVLFFSIMHVKKNAYLLPLMPAQTLLIAQALAFVLSLCRRPRFAGPWPRVLMAQAGIAIGLMPMLLVLCWTDGLTSLIAAIVAAAFAAIALLACRLCNSRIRPRVWLLGVAVAYVLLLGAFFNFHIALTDNRRSARRVCRQIAPLLAQPDLTLRTYDLPEEASLYLPLGIRYDVHAPRVLMIIDDHHQVPPSALLPKELDGDRVISARPVTLQDDREPQRWKVYELTIDRGK